MGSGYSKRKKQMKMLQQQLSQAQEDMQKQEFSGQAGNGLVRISVGGDYSVKSLKIDPECVDPEDIEGLEDLLKAAFNDVLGQMNQSSEGMSLPGFGDSPDLGALAKGLGL